MTRTMLPRRGPTPLASFLPRPIFPASVLPLSLSRSLDEFRDRTNEMLRSTFSDLPEAASAELFPPVNLSEEKDGYTLTAELPGLTAKDVTVDYLDGMLTIRGEKVEETTKEEDDRKFYIWERSFGSFQRSLPFPGGIDDSRITAEFKNGVLTVRMPKAESAEAKRHPIAVTEK